MIPLQVRRSLNSLPSVYSRTQYSRGDQRLNDELEEQMSDILIKNGTVVDGTGANAFTADVRVRDGVIVEVGPNLATGDERMFDASNCYVCPALSRAIPIMMPACGGSPISIRCPAMARRR